MLRDLPTLGRIVWPSLLAGFLLLTISGCGSAPVAKLYYVWPGAYCPPPSKADPNQTAGFTSRSAARAAARSETIGPIEKARHYIGVFESELRSAKSRERADPSMAEENAIATVKTSLGKSEAVLQSYLPCKRYVRRGRPNPAGA